MSSRKEPESELYMWALAYVKLLNILFVVLDLALLFVLLSSQ
jgi:hypothetical protein